MVKYFLTPGYLFLLNLPPLGRYLAEYINPGSYHYVNTRTKHIDKTLLNSLEQGIDQLIILGAGSDSRAYRFKEELKKVRIFEVDFPATQQKKKYDLEHNNIDHKQVTFIPIDFNSESLESAIFKSGFRKGLRNLFIWEGVSFYLSPKAVDQVLSFVKDNSAPGSSIIFDYVNESFVLQRQISKRAQKSFDFHKKLGEPYVFGIEDNGISGFMKKRGFEIISDLSPNGLEQTYLIRTNGKLHGHVFDYINIVHAKSVIEH
jgi:methyltransferase (TIGR00027 family)